MVVVVESLLTCAGEVDWIITVEHRLRHAAVPRRSATQQVPGNKMCAALVYFCTSSHPGCTLY